ncbi:MAG: hypothetical protein Tsb0014_24140 [Pleurocapsa sp.]
MLLTYPNEGEKLESFAFAVRFAGFMDMYSDIDTVANYLNAHEGWFCRCAQPMKVEPLGGNGYILTVGRFGSLGYEVEPKIAVALHPPVNGVYPMQTIPIPDYQPPGYDVVYEAEMKLTEIDSKDLVKSRENLFQKKASIPDTITQVSWTLNLSVTVDFPKFIDKLPKSMIQSTGDRLLAQIIRQISPRLTYKVQQDFHQSHNLAMPPKSSRKLEKVDS